MIGSLAFARIPRAEAREGWREATAAKPAGRSRVASAQFRLALSRMPRAEARRASLPFLIFLVELDKSIHGLLGEFSGIKVEVEFNERDLRVEMTL